MWWTVEEILEHVRIEVCEKHGRKIYVNIGKTLLKLESFQGSATSDSIKPGSWNTHYIQGREKIGKDKDD